MATKPANTSTPGRAAYHSGVMPNIYVMPNVREDPTWISQWKFDDISSTSGLDSQNQNHLKGSGTPAAVVGNRQSSGVEFDGVDDCFYLEWYEGSGLRDVIRTGIDVYPGNPNGETIIPGHDPHFGFIASLYIDDFSEDRILFSKWNEIGSDREWMVGVSTSGTIWRAYKKTNGQLTVQETQVEGLIPSGEWFDFMFGHQGTNNTSTVRGAGWFCAVNDNIMVQAHGFVGHIEEAGASGIFCIGAADVNGAQPSGFFKGRMEDVRFFNGSSAKLTAYNAYRSGVSPLTAYPGFNDTNPYIGMHWQMHLESGVPTDEAIDVGIDPTGEYHLKERKHNYYVYGSGSQFGENSLRREDGPFDGEFGSGLGFIGPTTNTGQHIFVRNNNFINPDIGFNPKGSFTVMYWINPYIATTLAQTFFGWRTLTIPNGPFTLQLANMRPTLYVGWDNNQRPSFGGFNPIPSGQWTHVAHVVNLEESRVDTYHSGQWIRGDDITTSGTWINKLNANIEFRAMMQATNATSYGLSGILDEVIVFNYAMPSGGVIEAYEAGSGFIIPAETGTESQGGYVAGVDASLASGILGGYIIVGPSASGNVGGYISGVPVYESGMAGGYILVGPSASGNAGLYLLGQLDTNDYLGGYLYGQGTAGLFEGGYVRGVEPVDQENNFVAFYNIIGRDKKEFDAQVQVAKSLGVDFDAMAVVYKDEKKPGTLMVNPPIAYSGTGAPVTVQFEARASGLQGKNIYRTFWFFSDDTSTSGSTISSSGTYTTEHTFAESGLFDVIFVAIDEKGLINSSRTLVNTAAGETLAEIRLTASPESGLVPLEVGFSGIIDSAPTEILDEYIYFGDGTRSPSTRSIYKMYPVIGCYIPCYRVRDAQGFIVTDSTVIGASN